MTFMQFAVKINFMALPLFGWKITQFFTPRQILVAPTILCATLCNRI